MLFSQIIGQDEVKHHLLQLVHHNRLSHALLFLGKEGSGALPLALAFAEYITLYSSANNKVADTTASLFGDEPAAAADTLIHTTAQEADAWTQKQAAYAKTAAMIHPDIHYSYPVVPKKSGDKPLRTEYD